MNTGWASLPWAVLLGLLLSGCTSPPSGETSNIESTADADVQRPEGLAGHWKSDEHGWELTFAPDGSIASAVISLGRVRVIPGQTTTVQTISGQQAIFEPGPWTMHYDPQTSQLTIRLTMKHVRVEMAGNTVEGAGTDVFAGPIDTAGGVWRTQWTAFSQYKASMPDGTVMDLSTDPTYGQTEPVTFTRVANP